MAKSTRNEPKTETVKVRYTGMASVRSFVKEDFTRHGIGDQEAVEFNHGNSWTADVSPEAAGYLIGVGEFTKVRNMQERPGSTATKADWQEAVRNSGGTVTEDMTVSDLEAAYDQLERQAQEGTEPPATFNPDNVTQSVPEPGDSGATGEQVSTDTTAETDGGVS